MRSVLVEFAMFPTDVGESKSEYVSEIVKMIRDSEVSYKLTPMGTVIETESIREALDIIERAYELLESLGSKRVYSALKFDIRLDRENRLSSKIESVEKKIGKVNS